MVICGLWKDSRVKRLAENDEILYLPNLDNYFVPDFYIYDLLDFQLSHFGEKNIKILSLTSESITYLTLNNTDPKLFDPKIQ